MSVMSSGSFTGAFHWLAIKDVSIPAPGVNLCEFADLGGKHPYLPDYTIWDTNEMTGYGAVRPSLGPSHPSNRHIFRNSVLWIWLGINEAWGSVLEYDGSEMNALALVGWVET